jgi:D-3-phosphoglycerate dehydrogenase
VTRPKALYYTVLNYRPENIALLERYFDVMRLTDPTEEDEAILSRTEVLFAPLGFMVDERKIAACPMLRVIASNTTGIPHIDVGAAQQRGIAICALHDEQAFLDTITPTAEHAIGLLMAAHRRIPGAHSAAASGAWSRWNWGAPTMLSRMRLGVVGYGRLGRRVVRIAQALEMDVAYYDPFVPGGCESLLALARRSDALSLHAPANDGTRGMISEEVLRALPRGAIVVNTARGELLDTDSLIACLSDGHVRAAALDTIDGEYEPGFEARFGNSALARYARTHDNLVLTPHIGGSTIDAWSLTQERVIRKALSALALESAAS